MNDARQYEYSDPESAVFAAGLLHAEGRDVWVHPEHRTAPVEHDVWIVTVKP